MMMYARGLQHGAAHVVALAGICLLALPAFAAAQGLENPLAYDSLAELVAAIARLVVIVGGAFVSLFIVYAGFKFLIATNFGKEGALQEAKKNFGYVLIGSILVLGAWALTELIAGTIDQLQ